MEKEGEGRGRGERLSGVEKSMERGLKGGQRGQGGFTEGFKVV